MRLVVDAHDVLLQQLYAAGLLLDLMPRTAGVPAELDETLGAVRHSITELRSTVRGLAQGRTTSLSAVVEVLTAQLRAWLGPCPTIELHLHGPDQVPESVAQDVLEALARTVHVTARRPGAAGSTLTVALDPAQDRVLLTLVGPDGRPVEEWTAEVSAHPHLRPSAK